MQFSPSKIWTIDRLHIQREIHNSIIMTIDPSGEDGTAAAEKKPKVFCDDKHRNGHINLGLNIFGFSKVRKLTSKQMPETLTCGLSPKTIKGAMSHFTFKHI